MREVTLLMTPGPTNIPDDIAQLLAMPTPHHRSQAFAKTFKKMRDNIQTILGSRDGEVITFASSGSGAMEAAIVNFNQKESEVLIVETGYFGTRFSDIATTYGLKTNRLSFTGGKSADVLMIKEAIEANPQIKTVYVTHHDTSTGVCNNIQAIGEMLKAYPEILFIIDSISGMVMHEVKMDEWGIDVVLAASQKGFMVPPGLAFACMNQKAIKRAKQADLPRFYFDIPKQLEMLTVGQTFATPAISLTYAMAYATTKIIEDGLETQYEMYKKRREYLEQKLIDANFTFVVKNPEDRGNVLIPILIPETIMPNTIVDMMEREDNIMIIGGYGEFKTTTVRIGVLGPITTKDIDDTVASLVRVINKIQQEEER